MKVPDRETWLRKRAVAATKTARVRARRIRTLVRMARAADTSGIELTECIVCGDEAVFHGLSITAWGPSPIVASGWCAKDACLDDMHSTTVLPVQP